VRIRELNITDEQRELIQKKSRWHKKVRWIIREITGVGPCFACDGIPDLVLIQKVNNVERIETYCRPCSEKLYQRTAAEPEDRTHAKLAAFYNCEIDTTGKLHVPYKKEYYYSNPKNAHKNNNEVSINKKK
jgi:hypothetical protein